MEGYIRRLQDSEIPSLFLPLSNLSFFLLVSCLYILTVHLFILFCGITFFILKKIIPL
jgi:hypothetical protein